MRARVVVRSSLGTPDRESFLEGTGNRRQHSATAEAALQGNQIRLHRHLSTAYGRVRLFGTRDTGVTVPRLRQLSHMAGPLGTSVASVMVCFSQVCYSSVARAN